MSTMIEWPLVAGTFNIIATGPGAILQCSQQNLTMFRLQHFEEFVFSGIEVKNCQNKKYTLPGVLYTYQVMYVNITNSYFHDNSNGIDSGGALFIDQAISFNLDNNTFENNVGNSVNAASSHLSQRSKAAVPCF